MCLAVPMKIKEINDNSAICEFQGLTRECDVSLIDNVKKGDFVIIHAGFAIQKLEEEKAIETIEELKIFFENEK